MEETLTLLRPRMPGAEQLRPYLERIDHAAWYTNFGPLSQQLESDLSRILDSSRPPQVATAASGTIALELALAALQLKPGSKVLLPSLTFPATATAICRAGHVPVFADVDSQTWALEEQTARSAADQIDAVVPVAIFGRPVDTPGWDSFTRDTGIPVVVDAAGAFGNQFPGATTTTVYSMHATKAFACGEGGFVASHDKEHIRRVWVGSNFGFDSGEVSYPGTNGKLSEYHAAIALAALEDWPEARRQRLALLSAYSSALTPLRGKVEEHAAGQRWVRSVQVVRIPAGIDDSTVAAMAGLGIETRRWYFPPVHEQPAFANHQRLGDLPVTRRLTKQLIGLPFHPSLPENAPTRVAEALEQVLPNE